MWIYPTSSITFLWVVLWSSWMFHPFPVVAPGPRGASPRSKACCKIWRQFCCRRISWRFRALRWLTNRDVSWELIDLLDKKMKNIYIGCFHMSHTHTYIYICIYIYISNHNISYHIKNQISYQISNMKYHITSYHIISHHLYCSILILYYIKKRVYQYYIICNRILYYIILKYIILYYTKLN